VTKTSSSNSTRKITIKKNVAARATTRKAKPAAGGKKAARSVKVASAKVKKSAGKKNTPPAEPITEIFRPQSTQIEALYQKGRVRGFITEDEVLYLFREIEEYVEEYEDFLDALDASGHCR
jgi:RNA polymerase primary sigma factor